MKRDRELKEIVKELVSKYIKAKPTRIRLKLNYSDDNSSISIKGKDLDETVDYHNAIDFNSFANGVLEAYEEVYGELKAVPISFREEIYENDKVRLDLYPTGSAGTFDIFVEYKILEEW